MRTFYYIFFVINSISFTKILIISFFSNYIQIGQRKIFFIEKNLRNKMKSQQTQIQTQAQSTQSVKVINRTKQSDFLIQITKYLENAQCSNNQQAFLLCCGKKCQQKGLICGTKKCSCKSNHKDCYKIQIQNLLSCIQQKIKQKKQVIQQIQQVFDKIIDKISQFRDQTILTLNQAFSQPQQYLSNVQQNSFTNMTGSQFNKIFQTYKESKYSKKQEKQKNKLQQQMDQLYTQIEKSILTVQKNYLSTCSNMLSGKIRNLNGCLQISTINSNILSKEEQIKTLEGFFDEKIVQLNLLYRASQYDFSVVQFYQNCSDVQNTIILAMTTQKKIIGGFTPLKWRKYKSDIHIQDPTGKTFLFSITNKDKLQIIDKSQATCYRPSYQGPRFGKYSNADFAIVNQSNKSNCYVFSTMNFKNQHYDKNAKHQAYKRFTGEDNQYFRTVEWEAFHVKFR